MYFLWYFTHVPFWQFDCGSSLSTWYYYIVLLIKYFKHFQLFLFFYIRTNSITLLGFVTRLTWHQNSIIRPPSYYCRKLSPLFRRANKKWDISIIVYCCGSRWKVTPNSNCPVIFFGKWSHRVQRSFFTKKKPTVKSQFRMR